MGQELTPGATSLIGEPYQFLVTSLFLIPAAFIAIPGHELGHALAAYLQGDRTPRNRGYFNLSNPRAYFNVYGIVAMFLARVAWGEPVPVNEYRLRGMPGRLAYALGGPLANLLLATLFGVLLRNTVGLAPVNLSSIFQPSPWSYLTFLLYAAFFLNLSMLAFNLLPIPGLDGWRVLEALFRNRNPRFFFDAWARRQAIWGICAIVYFIGFYVAGNLLAIVMIPVYTPASSIIYGACIGYPSLMPCPPSGHF